MADRSKGVIAALKYRKGLGSEKGVALLSIVKKLTAKRKAAKSEKDSAAHEGAESPKKEANEPSGA